MNNRVRLTVQRKPFPGSALNLTQLNHRIPSRATKRDLFERLDATHPRVPSTSEPARSSFLWPIVAGCGVALVIGGLVASRLRGRR